jgi:histidinol phosphatase-like PHP family hydrolase
VRRAQVLGIRAIGVTDHADASNLDFIIPRLVAVSKKLNSLNQIQMIPGIELTHVPPPQMASLAEQARSLGAKIVVAHGETIVEPVVSGTNRAALAAEIDILAHPGLISEEEVKMAAERGIFLEISARKGHSLTNGHVAQLAKKLGASLVLNSDAHEPSDLMTRQQAMKIALGAGLNKTDFERMQKNAESFLVSS